MSLELFSSKEVGEYTTKIFMAMKSEIEAFSDEKIMNCNLEEWADYYSEAYKIEPIFRSTSALTILPLCVSKSLAAGKKSL